MALAERDLHAAPMPRPRNEGTVPRHRSAAVEPPVLTVIEGGQGRYVRLMVAAVGVGALMLCAVAGRAYMAEQQLRLDKLNVNVQRARSHFDSLRARRAELQSPEVLISQARTMGMVPSYGNRVVAIPSDVAARVAASVGKIDSDIGDSVQSMLDEFGRLKATVGAG